MDSLSSLYPVHHIGIAVTDLDQAIAQYRPAFNCEIGAREKLLHHGVEIVFLDFANTKLELLAPLDANCPVAKFLAQRGPGLHHICFEVGDVNCELRRLKDAGYLLIDEVSRPGAQGAMVGFLHPKNSCGVLIELSQHP